jgi:rhodanese-related sulfurtransferase
MLKVKTFDQVVKEARSQITYLKPRMAKAIYDKADSPIIIDVREAEQRKFNKLKDSIHFPRGLIEWHMPREYPNPEQVIFTHCNHGARATLSALALQNMGYTNVYAIKEEIDEIKKFFD